MIKKFFAVAAVFFMLTACQFSIPSPMGTGSTYKGEINSDHIQAEIVFPWASQKQEEENKEDSL